MSVSIARIGAHAKDEARVPITAPVSEASTQAMTRICIESVIAIPHEEMLHSIRG
jgi:hypothetical protein